MKMKTEKIPLIPGFKAVESARAWKIKVAQETEGLSATDTLKYYRTEAKDLKPASRRSATSTSLVAGGVIRS